MSASETDTGEEDYDVVFREIGAMRLFIQKMDLDVDTASILARAGFTTLKDIASMPISRLLAVEGLGDEDFVTVLRLVARRGGP